MNESTSAAAGRVRSLATRVEVWAVVAVLVPIAVAVARHSTGRWLPIGDDALVELRSRDVFSWRHLPLLGTWSSASLTAGKDLNHPGPLLFDLLAVPVRLFGGRAGMAVGVGLINSLAVVGVAMVTHRLRGAAASVWATVVAGGLAWTMGSVMLTDAWNPHVLILPCLLMLVLAWGVAAGDVALLPWLLAAASLCLQTHLGYAYLVPTLCVAALVGAAVVYRRRWRTDPSVRAIDGARLRRTGLASVATIVVLWAQPLGEQLFGSGQGNMARILTSTGGDEPTVGPSLGIRIVARLVALPPWWTRASFVKAVPNTSYDPDGTTVSPAGLPGLGVAVAALVLVLGAVAVLGWWAWRRRDRTGTVAIAVALVAVALSLASLTIMPIGPLGLTPHQMRWLWPVSAFVVLSVVVNLASVRADRRVALAGLAVVAVVAVANLPAHLQLAGPESAPQSIAPARAISDQVAAWHAEGPVWLDTRELRVFEPYSAVVMAALQRGGVDVRVDEPGLVRQLGNARRATGNEQVRLVLREGRAAISAPTGATVVAFTSPLSSAEIDDVIAGEAAMVDQIALMGVTFTDAGARLVESGAFGATADEIVAASFDAEALVGSGMAAALVHADAIELDPSTAGVMRRTADLRVRLDDTTVAVFAESAG
jgi:hypothetical protein